MDLWLITVESCAECGYKAVKLTDHKPEECELYIFRHEECPVLNCLKIRADRIQIDKIFEIKNDNCY